MASESLQSLENHIPAQQQQWPDHWRGLGEDLTWFKTVFAERLESYFHERDFDVSALPPPELSEGCWYQQLVEKYQLDASQRLVFMLAWVAEFIPNVLDILQSKNKLYEAAYTEFGGMTDASRKGFQPTVQTAVFLLAGGDVVGALEARTILSASLPLFKEELLQQITVAASDINNDSSTKNPHVGGHGLLRLSEQTRQWLLAGDATAPESYAHFPAKRIVTEFDWQDLILPDSTLTQLDELLLWLKHGDTLRREWAMHKELPLGYKALFCGPPGTGKTLTAALLGKSLNKPVYRIDLSQLVSKYIGETEKNLEKVFTEAQRHDWILFFDEADALFGKRTQVSSANDRHANMETGYLLQRIEYSPNLVILASNLKDNIDNAFLRRFQSIVHFVLPGIEERLRLWRQGFSDKANLDEVNLLQIARQYELSGAEINSVIRLASLMALEHHQGVIKAQDLVKGIRREKYKAGQII